MKSLLFGIALIIVLGFGGLVYRNAVERPNRPIACPMDARVCPDGTAVARTGSDCTFPVCPLPNISLTDIGISFAIPEGFVTSELSDSSSVAAYEITPSASTSAAYITIRRYAISASSTALATIQQTAIGGASGLPVPITFFSSSILGTHRYTVVNIERFEGVINTAYYLARNEDVLRFDAMDTGADWTNPNLDISTLRAHSALKQMLVTLQGE